MGHSIDFFSLFDLRGWASLPWRGIVWYAICSAAV